MSGYLPRAKKDQLVSKKIAPKATYEDNKDQITKQPRSKGYTGYDA
jgi:hypothetical protein